MEMVVTRKYSFVAEWNKFLLVVPSEEYAEIQ